MMQYFTTLFYRLKRRKPSGRNQWEALEPLPNLDSWSKRNLEGGWSNLEESLRSLKVQRNLEEGGWSNLEVQAVRRKTRVEKLRKSRESLQDPLGWGYWELTVTPIIPPSDRQIQMKHETSLFRIVQHQIKYLAPQNSDSVGL